MKLTAIISGVALCAVAIGCGTILVIHDHPWFAILVFLLACSVRVRVKD